MGRKGESYGGEDGTGSLARRLGDVRLPGNLHMDRMVRKMDLRLSEEEMLRAWAIEQACGCTAKARQILDFVRPPTKTVQHTELDGYAPRPNPVELEQVGGLDGR